MTPLVAAVDLETIPLFRGLSPTEHHQLHALLGVRSFPAGVDILTAEEPGSFRKQKIGEETPPPAHVIG